MRDLVWEGSEWETRYIFHCVSSRIVWHIYALLIPYICITFLNVNIFVSVCYLEILIPFGFSLSYIFVFKRNLIGVITLIIKEYITNCWWLLSGASGPRESFHLLYIYFHDIWTPSLPFPLAPAPLIPSTILKIKKRRNEFWTKYTNEYRNDGLLTEWDWATG